MMLFFIEMVYAIPFTPKGDINSQGFNISNVNVFSSNMSSILNLTSPLINSVVYVQSGNATDLYNKLTSCGASGYCTVYILSGTYDVNETIYIQASAVHVIGIGNPTIRAKLGAKQNIMFYVNASSGTYENFVVDCRNILNTSVYVKGNGNVFKNIGIQSFQVNGMWFKDTLLSGDGPYYNTIYDPSFYQQIRFNNSVGINFDVGSNANNLFGGRVYGNTGIRFCNNSQISIYGTSLETNTNSDYANSSRALSFECSYTNGIEIYGIRSEAWNYTYYFANNNTGCVSSFGGRTSVSNYNARVYNPSNVCFNDYYDTTVNLGMVTMNVSKIYSDSLGGISNDGLSLYMSFSDTSLMKTYNITTDRSPLSYMHVGVLKNNLSVHNNVSTYQPLGKVGRGLNFDGINDYVRITAGNVDKSLTSYENNQLTISVWLNPNEEKSQGYVSKKNGNDDGDQQWSLQGSTTQLLFGLSNATNSMGNTYFVAACTPTVGVWNHIVAVYDGGTNVYAYKNGILCQQATVSGVNISRNSTRDLCIGAVCSSLGSSFFNGSIDEVMVYTRALSSSEVQGLYQYGAGNMQPFEGSLNKEFGGTVYGNITILGSTNQTGSEYHSGSIIQMGTNNFTKPILATNISMWNGTAYYCLQPIIVNGSAKLSSGAC